MNLPPDPDECNDLRAGWAQKALDTFAHEACMDTAGEEPHTMLEDLLDDLMHWCDRNGVNFDNALETARQQYAAETGE